MADPETVTVALGAVDRIANRIIGALNGMLGFQYSESAEHYVYQVTVLTAAAAAIGTLLSSTFRVTQEAAFVCTRLVCGARVVTLGTAPSDIAGSVVTIAVSGASAGDFPDAPFLLRVTDGGTDRTLSNEAVDAFFAYGTSGGIPGMWSRPRYFKPSSIVTCDFTTLKTIPATATWRLKALFSGWKVYLRTPPDLTVRRA